MTALRFAIGLMCLEVLASIVLAGEQPTAEAFDFFERKVRPLLVEKCQKCHGENKSCGNLRLSSREAILAGGDTGPAAVPGKPDESLLVKAVEYDGDVQMPPEGKLPESDIATLKRWVELDLPWPQSPAAPAGEAPAGSSLWSQEQRNWWSFQPLRPVVPPAIHSKAPVRNAIDQFLQSQIDVAGLEPFPAADKRVLIRRATFDLTGLPPTPEEVDVFVNEKTTDMFGRQCLLARRLVERGVRFVQLYDSSSGGWDHHSKIKDLLPQRCAGTDQQIAALLYDLKSRGLLDETLVIWGGEFGRTPTAQGTDGREHHPFGFTMWLAGGGIRGGMVHGATDEYGWHAVANKVHVHDLHATILHLMGIDHERLTYRWGGRDYRLTDVSGNVVREILA